LDLINKRKEEEEAVEAAGPKLEEEAAEKVDKDDKDEARTSGEYKT